MRVILIKDVKKLGQKNDIVQVKDGFAHGYLIPNRLAVVATNSELKKIANKKEIKQKLSQNSQEKLNQLFQKINNSEHRIVRNANNKGVLFASIDANEIAKIISLNKEFISLENPIKKIGEQKIDIKIGDNKGSFTLIIQEN